MSEHPRTGPEYAPETCEACAGSFGPCYGSQVQRREAERGAILAAAEREAWAAARKAEGGTA